MLLCFSQAVHVLQLFEGYKISLTLKFQCAFYTEKETTSFAKNMTDVVNFTFDSPFSAVLREEFNTYAMFSTHCKKLKYLSVRGQISSQTLCSFIVNCPCLDEINLDCAQHYGYEFIDLINTLNTPLLTKLNIENMNLQTNHYIAINKLMDLKQRMSNLQIIHHDFHKHYSTAINDKIACENILRVEDSITTQAPAQENFSSCIIC
jgi:3-dehydroquinate dehydratase